MAASTATETATAQPKGKARKMLVISKREVGESSSLTDTRSTSEIALNKVKAKFNFEGGMTRQTLQGAAAATVRNDSINFTGTIRLPAGLDLTQEQDVWIGIGNIVDHVKLGAKGKPQLPSDAGYLKKFRIKLPRLEGTLTAGDEEARVDFTLSVPGASTAGFDTEGVSVQVTGADKTPVERQIQVGLLLSGVAYQSSIKAQFKTRVDRETGTPVSGELSGMSRTVR